jgi:hypothetical protein
MLLDILVWVLRAFGVLYIVGGVLGARQAWFWARIEPDLDRVTRILQSYDPKGDEDSLQDENIAQEDRGRQWWLLAGCVMLIPTGIAMLVSHQVAVLLLSLTIVHQLFYFARQRRRELKAPNVATAEDARVERSTINGFYALLIVTVLAAWLFWQGALWH